ncbi:type I restriction enzyme, S subunit [Flavobacterium succinicans]|uniref:Type I restriction enzyme, S subunit n=1 Tax=Flavobacterium succinicans TaxID=29536 RepID=A0A1I4V2J8_9FLAO|nr:restriction endonuclease subunit S [Flavobacterium succinicans]SFM95375.1 type I restriction enzyme, S subunit [Flavobacterium succinicans]
MKQGYKNSELGIIPEEWEVKKLGDILKNYSLGGNYENVSGESDLPLIKMGNVGRGRMNISKVEYLAKDVRYSENDILHFNDILFNTRNTLELVGKVAIWKNELAFALYNSNLMRMYFKEEFIDNNDFINFQFNSGLSLSNLKRFATGTTSVAAIYTKDLLKLKIPLPPLAEQKAIADCLATWDKVIAHQTLLIKAKEERKKALMQQLLTGKKRLTGFTEEWKMVKLGDLFSERNETKIVDLPLLSIGQDGVYPQTDSNKRDISNNDKSKYKRIAPGDIGYNTMRMWQGRSALSSLEGIVSPAYTILTPKKNVNSYYFSILFKTTKLTNLFWRNSQGLVDDTLNCKYKDFSKIKYWVPSFEEQTAIATILNTAEKEIEIEEQKLADVQQQKKGLMQQLLTGKVRLV